MTVTVSVTVSVSVFDGDHQLYSLPAGRVGRRSGEITRRDDLAQVSCCVIAGA